MQLDPSLNNYAQHPQHLHLKMEGGRLTAVSGEVKTVHELTPDDLSKLKKLAETSALAKATLNALHAQDPSKTASLQGKVSREELPHLIEILANWCQEGIGKPIIRNSNQPLPPLVGDEHGIRVIAAERIKQCYLEGGDRLDLSELPITHLPDGLTMLLQLRSLDLRHTEISSFPEWVTWLIKLEYLDLSYTQIKTIPDWVSRCPKLAVLDVSYTQVTTIPDIIFNLKHLELLSLAGDQITTLPDWIAEFAELETLDVNGTGVKEIPLPLARLSNECTIQALDTQLTEPAMRAFKNEITKVQEEDQDLGPECNFPTDIAEKTPSSGG